jgi:hypothetical protein
MVDLLANNILIHETEHDVDAEKYKLNTPWTSVLLGTSSDVSSFRIMYYWNKQSNNDKIKS